jgi:hypothetical protein
MSEYRPVFSEANRFIYDYGSELHEKLRFLLGQILKTTAVGT